MNAAIAKKASQPETTNANVVWFVARGSTLKGPFTTEQIEEKVRKKELTYYDFCWRQGFREWRPLSSVEEFDRRGTDKRAPIYPSVELPGGQTQAPRSIASVSNVIPLKKEPNRVQVSFSHNRRHSITAYEWAVAVVFAVGLAYLASSFALNEVRSSVLGRIELLRLGQMHSFGEAAHAVDPSFWAPLYSAPSFRDMPVMATHPRQPQAPGEMPVVVRGQARLDEHGVLRMGPYAISSHSKLPVWQATAVGLSPVYAGQVEMRGYLSPTNGGVVLVKEPGDPGLFRNP